MSTPLECFESKCNTSLSACFNYGLLRFKLKQFPYVVNVSFSKFHKFVIIGIAILLKFENNIRESYQSGFFFLFQSLCRIYQLSQVLKILAVPRESMQFPVKTTFVTEVISCGQSYNIFQNCLEISVNIAVTLVEN